MKKIYPPFLFCFILFLASIKSFATFPIQTTVTDPTCDGAHNGIITVTALAGVSPYTYSTDGTNFQSSGVFASLLGGNYYTVVVMDVNGDIGSEQVYMNSGIPLTANVSSTAALCHGGANGTLTINSVNATSPFDYELEGTFDSIYTNAPASLYVPGVMANPHIITITDALGCYGQVVIQVQDGDPLTATATIFNPASCTGSNDAIVTFDFSLPGTSPFWLDDQLNNLSGLFYGGPNDPNFLHDGTTYNFTIMDWIGCTGTFSVVVPPGLPAVTHAGNDAGICTGGSVQLSGSNNGAPWAPYYQWSPSAGLDNPDIANPIAAPPVTTTYTLTTWTIDINAPNPNSTIICQTSNAVTITVVDVQAPAIAQNASVLSVSNSQAGVAYTWQQNNSGSWDDVGTGTNYTAISGNEYRVKATSGGCEIYSTSFNAARMVNTNPYGVISYPNPTTNVLRLTELKLEDGWQTAEIISSQGLRTFPVNDIRNKTTATFNVAGLGAGVYLVKLTGADGKTTTLTFIKQ